MLARFVVLLLVVLAGVHPMAAAADKDAASFEQFKRLAGEWVGKGSEDGQDKELHVKYRVTSGGTAVVETLNPGADDEMVTMIHPDGKDLLLTHYCMLGNQPQMKAPAEMTGKEVAFSFVRATNLASDKGMYRHDVTYAFEGPDTLKTTWTHYHDGKAAGKVVFELKRKK